jgi:excisionase family DNA binding protein
LSSTEAVSTIKGGAVVTRDPSTSPVENPSAAPQPASGTEVTVNGVGAEVPPELAAAVRRAREGSKCELPQEMTTTQAADFLDVSRPFLLNLIKRGELPCRFAGKQRRIPTSALLEQRERMFQHARAAADEMVRIAQEHGLYELEGPPPKVP